MIQTSDGTVNLRKKPKAIGYKQALRAVRKGEAVMIYVAADVDAYMKRKLDALLQESGLPAETMDSMASLGKACGIDVGAAVVAVLRENP